MLRDVLASVFVLLFVAGQSSAGVITFSTLHNDITVGSTVIPGHGLPKDSAYPVFTWNYTGTYADPKLSAYILDFNNNNQITVCTNGICGTNGGNYGFNRAYTGYEFIYFGFALPADAPNLALNPKIAFPSGGPTYDGTGFVNSGILVLPNPHTFKLTFTKPGTYTYDCLVHPDMDGTVSVTP